MLLHCKKGLEIAGGEKSSKQTFLGKMLSPFFKSLVTSDKPFRHGSPSPSGTIFSETGGFEKEIKGLTEQIQKFYSGGIERCGGNVHAFFGKLTPAEWGMLMYKHTDHHLRQFGA